jgi:hypothetical protein
MYRQYPSTFAMSELVKRIQEPAFIARRELKALQDIGLVAVRKNAAAKRVGDREQFTLNPEFDFFGELGQLILKASPTEQKRMSKRIAGLGRVKLAVISGIFLAKQEQTTFDAPADLFLVGDDIDRKKLSAFLRSLEAEMGGEVRFAIMDKEQFTYRYDMFDRFIRVLLEGPHVKLIDRLEV